MRIEIVHSNCHIIHPSHRFPSAYVEASKWPRQKTVGWCFPGDLSMGGGGMASLVLLCETQNSVRALDICVSISRRSPPSRFNLRWLSELRLLWSESRYSFVSSGARTGLSRRIRLSTPTTTSHLCGSIFAWSAPFLSVLPLPLQFGCVPPVPTVLGRGLNLVVLVRLYFLVSFFRILLQ